MEQLTVAACIKLQPQSMEDESRGKTQTSIARRNECSQKSRHAHNVKALKLSSKILLLQTTGRNKIALIIALSILDILLLVISFPDDLSCFNASQLRSTQGASILPKASAVVLVVDLACKTIRKQGIGDGEICLRIIEYLNKCPSLLCFKTLWKKRRCIFRANSTYYAFRPQTHNLQVSQLTLSV